MEELGEVTMVEELIAGSVDGFSPVGNCGGGESVSPEGRVSRPSHATNCCVVCTDSRVPTNIPRLGGSFVFRPPYFVIITRKLLFRPALLPACTSVQF